VSSPSLWTPRTWWGSPCSPATSCSSSICRGSTVPVAVEWLVPVVIRCSSLPLSRSGAGPLRGGSGPSRAGWPARRPPRRGPYRARRRPARRCGRQDRLLAGLGVVGGPAQVAGQEALPVPGLPGPPELAQVVLLVGQRHRRGVGAGPQHSGHVLERRRRAGPFLERAGRLALEVEHEPAGVGPQHLPEVVV